MAGRRTSGAVDRVAAPAANRPDASADRKREIIEAAIAVIARQGLSDTTVDRVALAAGVSPGLVIAYFKRKDQLLLEVLRLVAYEFETARAAVLARANGDASQALHDLIDLTFDTRVSSPERLAVWYAFWGEANARALYRDTVGALDQTYLVDIERLIQSRIVETGRTDLDAEAVAIGFAGTLEYLWQGILSEGRRFDRKRATRIARAYLTGIFQHGSNHSAADRNQTAGKCAS